jgi:uncharacterized membrane protein YfcA
VDSTAFQVAAILFVATFIRSAFGFGEALVAVPLLALFMPVTVAAPIAALVSVTVAAVVVVQDWRHVQWKSAVRLVLATAAGIPLGLLLLTHAPEPLVKTVLALIIIAFSLHALRSGGWHLASDATAWMFGVAAGILGGAYGMNGPPLAVYGSARRWSSSQFRATLQAYFLPASAAGMVGYWWVGLWTRSVTRIYLLSLPIVLVAAVLGRLAGQRMSTRRFVVAIYMGLLLIGVALLIQAARFSALTIL